MYRAMTLKVLQQGIDIHDKHAIALLADKTEISLEQRNNELQVLLDNNDVTAAIRTQAVTKSVSAVSMVKEVRELMVRAQRKMSERGSIIVEGRDIGTVVFPHADLKFFMVADVHKRAVRRHKELHQQGVDVSIEALVKEIHERDQKDSGRELSPLRKSDDAIEIDTSNLSIEEQVNVIVQKVEEIQQQHT